MKHDAHNWKGNHATRGAYRERSPGEVVESPKRSLVENLRLIREMSLMLPDPECSVVSSGGEMCRSDIERLKTLIGYAQDALAGSDYGYALDASRDCDIDGIQY